MTTRKKREPAFAIPCWDDLRHWAEKDRKKYRRVMKLIAETCRDHVEGAGKPERLRGNQSGRWSRRIDHDNRLVYELTNGFVRFIQARYHYSL